MRYVFLMYVSAKSPVHVARAHGERQVVVPVRDGVRALNRDQHRAVLALLDEDVVVAAVDAAAHARQLEVGVHSVVDSPSLAQNFAA